MKTKLILLFVLILSILDLHSQNKKNPPKPAIPEIDRLYSKYKDTKEITLYTSHGELYGNVYIDMNEDSKPISITISGNCFDKKAISEFISNTIKMKLNQGYKIISRPPESTVMSFYETVLGRLGFSYNTESSFNVEMRKGTLYFLASAGFDSNRGYNYNLPSSDLENLHRYNFSIETGELKRKGGNKAEKFDF